MLKHLFDLPAGDTVNDTAPQPSLAERAADCRARADTLRLLSGVFVEEAATGFLAALRTPEMLEQFASLGLCFDADFLTPSLAELADALAVEYATLFAASGGFPPVESVRLFGRYKQAPNHDTMRFYQDHGFVLRPGRHEVFADQLGVELLFVAELLARTAALFDAGDEVGARRNEKAIKRYWVLHLGRWVRGYAQLIARTAQHSFYREMARFLAAFAAEEIAALGLNIEDIDQGKAIVPKVEVKVEFDPEEPVCNACVGEALGRQQKVHVLQDLR